MKEIFGKWYQLCQKTKKDMFSDIFMDKCVTSSRISLKISTSVKCIFVVSYLLRKEQEQYFAFSQEYLLLNSSFKTYYL